MTSTAFNLNRASFGTRPLPRGTGRMLFVRVPFRSEEDARTFADSIGGARILKPRGSRPGRWAAAISGRRAVALLDAHLEELGPEARARLVVAVDKVAASKAAA